MIAKESPEICPICNNGRKFTFLQDFYNDNRTFTLYECSVCRVQFWTPFKNPGALWYQEGGFYEVKDILQSKISREYHKQFLKRHSGSLNRKKILDVGCGTGEFLAALQERGSEVWGVDFDRTAISVAKKRFRLEHVYAMSMDDFFTNIPIPQFDFITCFEVIEHADNPLKLIQSLEKQLKPDGMLVISAPSRERLGANFNTWDFPPNHLTRWNKEALLNLLSIFHFDISSVFYVEQFRILLEAVNGRFRFGLMQKAVVVSSSKKTRSFFVKVAVVLALVKEYLIGGMPALFLWFWSMIARRKNGIMIIEFTRQV